MTDSIKLRPHHLLCIRNFKGEGYDSAFTRSMAEIVQMLRRNPEIEIFLTNSTDDICANCPNNKNGCVTPEKVCDYDSKVLRLCSLDYGINLSWMALCKKTDENIFFAGRFAQICSDCCWGDICHKKS